MIKLHYGGTDHLFLEDEILNFGQHYNRLCNIPSDINEHLPTLKRYASECQSVTEMGVRFACSTWAFIEARPKKITCIDIRYDFFEPSEKWVKKMCEFYNIEFIWKTDDSLKIEIEQTDLLFIDTLHTFNQLSKELEKHHKFVSKYIILHDTTTFGHIDESIYGHASNIVKSESVSSTGLRPALNNFLTKYSEWKIKEDFTNNNGLTVIERVSKSSE